MRAAQPALLLMLLAACGHGEAKHGAAAAQTTNPGERDANALGAQLFELVDRAADYRASHSGRYPASIARMGIDSLTPTTARRLALTGGQLTVTVAFRKPAGHAYASCSGGGDVLESASLNSGTFTVVCVTPAGQAATVPVSGVAR